MCYARACRHAASVEVVKSPTHLLPFFAGFGPAILLRCTSQHMSRRLDPPRSVEQGGAGGGVGSFLSSVAALSFGGWGATLNAGASPSRSPSPPARRARRSSGWDDSTAPEERPRSQVLTTRRAPRIAPLDAPPPLARARTAGQAQQPELMQSPYAVLSAAAQAQTHLSGPRLSALASPRHSAASRPSSSVARAPLPRKQRDDVSVRGVSRGSVEYSPAPQQPPPAAQRPPFQPPAHLPAPPPTPPQRWLSPPRQMVADDTASAAVSAVGAVPLPEASQADDLRDDCGGGAAEPPGVAMRHDDVALEAAAPAEEEQLDGWALLFGAAGETVQSRCASDAGATQVIVDVTHQPVALLRWLRRSQMAAGAASLNSTGRGGSPPVMPRGTYPGRSGSPSRNMYRLAATPAANILASTLATGDGDPPSWHWLTPGQATALRLFTAAQAPHLLLLGGPSSGKSWALSAMAATYASRARAAVPQSGGSGQDHTLRRTAPQPQSRAASSRGSPSGAGARFVLCCAPTAALAYRTFGPASASPPVVVMSVAAALAKAATSRSWLAGADAVLVDNALEPLSPQAASSLASLLVATSSARATMRRPAPVIVLAGDPGDGRGVCADAPWGYATSCPEVASCLDLTRARGHHTGVDVTARGCAALMLTSSPGHGVFSPTDTAAVTHLARWLTAAHALRRAAAPHDEARTHIDTLRALLPAAATQHPAVTLTWGPRLSAEVVQPQRRGAVPLPHPCVDLAWADSGSRQRDKGGSTQPPANSPGAKAAASAAWDAMPVPLRRCAGDGSLLLGGDVAPGDVVFACAPLQGQLQHSTGKAGAPRPKVMVPPGALGTVTAVTAAPSGQWAETVSVAFHIAPPPQQPPASSAQSSAAAAPAGLRRRGWTTAVCQVGVRSTAAFPFSARHSVAMSGVRPGVATGIYLPLLPLVTLHMGGDASHEDVDTASLAQLLQSAAASGGDPAMVSGCHVDVDGCRALGHMAAALLPACVTSLTVREAAAASDGDGDDGPLAALAAAAAAAHRCLFGPCMDVTPVPAVSPSTPQALPPPRAALPPVVVAPVIELPSPPPPPLAQMLPRAPAPARATPPPALVTVPVTDEVAAGASSEEDKAAALATAVRTVQLLHHLHTARSALVASLDATMSPRGTGQAGGRDSVPKTPRFAAELAIPAFVPPQPQPPAPPQPQPPAPAPAPTPRPAPQAALPPGWSAEPLAYLQAPGTSQAAILSAVEHAGPSPFDAIRAAAAAAGEEGAAAVRNMLRRAEERAATNTSPSRK